MSINLKDSLELILAIAAVIAIGYRISKVETAIYAAMDKIEDQILEELRELRSQTKIHWTDYTARKEWQDSVIHQLNEKVDHKFNRVHGEVKELQRYLEKSGFKTRQYGVDDSNS